MKRFFLAAVVLLLAVQAEAEVKLPALLGSNMVLQRNTEVNFWGEASPRSRVLLTARGTVARTTPRPTLRAGGR